MSISKQHLIYAKCIFIFFICSDITMSQDSPCGDWELYKDEKCFKVFDKVVNEQEAKKTCSQQENSSTLVTIYSKDEQDFLSNLLFKTHKVVDAVWIGAKYSSIKFKWIDGSGLIFTNWADGSPSNTSDKACVQMIPEGSLIGKWADEPCNKNNKFVCQKMQNWSISRLQKTLLDARKELSDSIEDVKKQINNQQMTISNQQTTISSQQATINNLNQNPVPVGFIYVQLPSQPEPTILWSTVQWTDVTSNYAGLFFRALGGNSEQFGVAQGENSPRLTNVEWASLTANCNSEMWNVKLVIPGTWTQWIGSGILHDCRADGHRFYVSGGEVRPRNMAMRIWKRTN